MKKYYVYLFGTVLILAFQNCGGGFQSEHEQLASVQEGDSRGPESQESSALATAVPAQNGVAVETVPRPVLNAPPTQVPLPTVRVDEPVSPPVVNPPTVVVPNIPLVKTWVVRADQSNVTLIGGGRDLSLDATELKNKGVAVFSQNKYLNIKAGAAPTETLSIMNGFEIAKSDLSKATSLGFTSLKAQLPAVSCAGKEAVMIFGQSNAANSATSAETQVLPRVFMFYNGYCYPARDPLLGGTIHTVGAGGSVGMKFAKLYRAKYPTKDLVLLTIGYGGSSIADWNTSLLSRLTTALALAKSAKLNISKIFWHQGETDTINNTSEQAYYDHFINLKSKIRASGATATIYMAVASAMSFRPYWVSSKVQNAQYRLIEGEHDIELAAESDILGTEFRSAQDGLHLNVNGTTELARQFFENAFVKVAATNETMVSSYYRTFLNRTPSVSEVNYWVAKLRAGQNLAQVRLGIRDSDEGFAREMYRSYTNRLASQTELNYWMSEAQINGRVAADQSFKAAVVEINNNGSYDASQYDLVELNSVFNVLGLKRVLQPRLSYWRFDQANGVWVRR